MNDYNWMHVVSTLACHNFLKMEEVLEQNVVDVFSYMTYMQAKMQAERAQKKFLEQIQQSRSRNRN